MRTTASILVIISLFAFAPEVQASGASVTAIARGTARPFRTSTAHAPTFPDCRYRGSSDMQIVQPISTTHRLMTRPTVPCPLSVSGTSREAPYVPQGPVSH